MKSKILAVVSVSLLLSGHPSSGAATTAASAGRPRLLLFLVVDQMRYDYLDRFRGRLDGGLKRLLTEGAVFTEARHGHAVSTTGPGHAALATGTHPGRNGIIDNSWFDRATGETVNCVEDPESPMLGTAGGGRSPRHLLRGGLADWIKQVEPAARVFSASRKDRGAILPGGLRADAAFWYDAQTGRFVTSEHYMKRYPDWVRDFNADDWPGSYFGRQWEPLAATPDPRSDSTLGIGELSEGAFARRFPITMGSATMAPDGDFYSDFGSTPLMDEYLGRFAEAMTIHEELGVGERLDFLALSFSALDSVGHDFGPNSVQVLDAVTRLDRTLGRLFEFLDRRIGRDRYWVSLSSDHGVMGVPEYLDAENPGSARRFNERDRLCFQRAGLAVKEELGDENWFLRGFYLDYEALSRRDLRRSEAEAEIAALLQRCEAVAMVWTRGQLESTTEGEFLSRYRRGHHPGRSPDLAVQLRESVISVGGRGTTHGSPYEYDVHVPLLIWGPGVSPRQIAAPVSTVDLAPTLADLLGIPAPTDLDGVSRASLLREGAEGGR